MVYGKGGEEWIVKKRKEDNVWNCYRLWCDSRGVVVEGEWLKGMGGIGLCGYEDWV